MSSTNRSNARESHIADYYVTPISDIIDFINLFHEKVGPLNAPIFDPCAGGDNTTQMSYPSALEKFGYSVLTSDLRADSPAELKENFLTETKHKDEFKTIITNPPFNLAFEMLQKGYEDLREGGRLIFLLRLNFWGSKKRNAQLRAHMPEFCFIHSKRMSFVKNEKTDSIEYAHFVWTKGKAVDFTKTFLI